MLHLNKDDDNSNIAVGESKSSNGENPFDFIGEKHNEILNYMGLIARTEIVKLIKNSKLRHLPPVASIGDGNRRIIS